jgi:type IV secretion system protein VirB4
LANPALDRQQYAEVFRLNAVQLDQLASLRPRRELLLKREGLSKVLTLDVDPQAYAWYANTSPDHGRGHEDEPIEDGTGGRDRPAALA